ncbi:hypothetical protein D9M72_491490 [compost metagenome]
MLTGSAACERTADGGTAVPAGRPGAAVSGNCTGTSGSGTSGSGTYSPGRAGTGKAGSGTGGTVTSGNAGARESTTDTTPSAVPVSVALTVSTSGESVRGMSAAGGAAVSATLATTSVVPLTTGSTTSTTVAAVSETGSGTAATGTGTSWIVTTGVPSVSGSSDAAFAVPANQTIQAAQRSAAITNGRTAPRNRSRKMPPIQITPRGNGKSGYARCCPTVQTPALAE